MNVVLMRHAPRRLDALEEQAGLTDEGEHKARETAIAIRGTIEAFDVVLYGASKVAEQTAQKLECKPNMRVLYAPLSPGKEEELSLKETKTEIEKFGLDDKSSVAIVGHDPGISTLLSSLTRKQCRIIERGEAVLVTGLTRSMDSKKAIVSRTFGSTYSPELVRKKIELKMTVSTFLAGFTIPVLVELVKNRTEGFSDCRALATILFTLALGFYVAAVYMYDVLLMPKEYWGPITNRPQPSDSSNSEFWHNYRLNGPLYAYMFQTWKWIFTPAVVFTSIAFLLLLIEHFVKVARIGSWLGYMLQEQKHGPRLVLLGCLFSMCVSVGVYSVMRPRLGIKD